MIICFLNSALDAESEKIVQEALDYAVKGNKTFINEDPLKYIIFIVSIFLFLPFGDMKKLCNNIL